MKKIRNFDLFPKASYDITNQSLSGGVFTVISLSLMVVLFFSETSSYLAQTVKKETIIDQDRGAKMLQINVDISFLRAPCALLGLDQVDTLGNHLVNVASTIKKTRLDAEGNQLEDQTESPAKLAIENEEGCRLSGYISVNKVPGNFHFSFHSQSNVANQLPRELTRKVKLDHTINHLSLGREHKNFYISKVFGEGNHTNFAPYDGESKADSNSGSFKHQYYMKVIPSQFIDDSSGEEHYTYLFSMNYLSQPINAQFGAVFFRYDIESITMKYVLEDKSFAHYTVSLCAILGGVFAVIGLVNSVFQEFLRFSKVS